MPDTIPPPAGDTKSEIDVEFEKWATTSAKLLRRSVIERAEALRESGIANKWKEIDEFWYEALIQDIDSGRLERLDLYMDLCRNEMEARLRAEGEVKSPLDAIGGPLDPPSDEPGSEKPAEKGKPMASVTPPLGSSSDSIEIDLSEIDVPGEEEDDDEEDDDEGSPDDTRVSPVLSELTEVD